MNQVFALTQEDRHRWLQIAAKANQAIFAVTRTVKGEYEIEVRELKKTKSSKQLKGFHRLVGILLPRFQEWTGEYWDSAKIKELIKKRYGYTTKFKGVEICKSCKDATKDEMIGLIKETEMFAAEMGVENCHLENQEMIELINYYNNL